EHPARGYAPHGERAAMEVPDRHVRVNQVSTITPTGKVRFMTYTGTMTAALFLVFLGRLLRSTTGKVFLILDRLRAHRTAAGEAWLAAHQDRIEVFELPRYAPERNPDGDLKNDLKRRGHEAGFPPEKGKGRARIETLLTD